MTFDAAVKKHRELWDWLSKHPGKRKNDYAPAHGIVNNCFFCEYTKGDCLGPVCKRCPGIWPQPVKGEIWGRFALG